MGKHSMQHLHRTWEKQVKQVEGLVVVSLGVWLASRAVN